MLLLFFKYSKLEPTVISHSILRSQRESASAKVKATKLQCCSVMTTIILLFTNKTDRQQQRDGESKRVGCVVRNVWSSNLSWCHAFKIFKALDSYMQSIKKNILI